ncbi:AAA family ATPase [Desulfomonile tiedjei]|uniref:Putative ATPase n=1 Tax=Desulfomonile tiedjei (strain ATCC 49306 / DSM 6799 / DCB-1) TaxID=706587 RepID=I4C449_DESTA|nr:AAA family ATPase [Desulfomonile tiedjei]AFM24340.1 putative ATPase [Desulfomonile tiedjei DSM 6799]
MDWRLTSIEIQGYRPFKEAVFTLGPLVVLVGANGAGKSSLFEFLRFLRDSAYQELPAEIVAGSIGQQIFHIPGPEKFSWKAEIDTRQSVPIVYEGEVLGPVGRVHVSSLIVRSQRPVGGNLKPFVLMEVHERKGEAYEFDPVEDRYISQKIELTKANQSALSIMTNPAFTTLYNLKEYLTGWRFYSSFAIANEKIRRSVPVEQEPVLHEDAGNLSSVLHYLMLEHREQFDELQQFLRLTIPGFAGLSVKARGGPGEVMAFWQEKGIDRELSLADLADGILRLICWATICVHPHPPRLICIDEPDQGVHPRTLPILAGFFQKASERTQILLATHASYFLTQFDLEHIAVMRKNMGRAEFVRPHDSAALRANLEDFGPEELEALHRSDELEQLP